MNDKEKLCEFVTVTMTPTERRLLEQIAEENGATLRGTIRRLIRLAGNNTRTASDASSRKEVSRADSR